MTEEFEDGLGVEIKGSIVVFTMYNPGRRNAFFPEMRRKLSRLLKEYARDPAIRAMVITGADSHFCTGADLSRVQARTTPITLLEARDNMKDVLELFRHIALNTKPVIAAVEGDAYGAGCSIALACDVVVATPKSRFGMAFSKIGVVPDMGMFYSLSQRVGRPKAKQMMMRSSVLYGEEAVNIGLADELAAEGEALARALEIGEEFAQLAPIPLAMIKSALGSNMSSVEDAIGVELDLAPIGIASDDVKEGVMANREKRKPVFKGS